MSNFREAFFSKYTLILVGLFFLSIWLMTSIEDALTVKNTALPALLFLVPAAIWFYAFVLPTIKK